MPRACRGLNQLSYTLNVICVRRRRYAQGNGSIARAELLHARRPLEA